MALSFVPYVQRWKQTIWFVKGKKLLAWSFAEARVVVETRETCENQECTHHTLQSASDQQAKARDEIQLLQRWQHHNWYGKNDLSLLTSEPVLLESF